MFNVIRLKDSKLSTRASWLFASGLLLIMGGSLCVLSLFFLQSISQIEHEFIARSNQQARETIFLKLNEMATRSMDWAYWDETYQLLSRGDSEFAARNLSAESLRTNDVDLMVFLSRQGQVREAVELSPAAPGVMRPLTPSRWQALSSSEAIGSRLSFLLQRPDQEKKPVSGIIALQGEPYLIAVTPVLTSLYQGPIAGWMIWGKRIKSFFPAQYQRILATDAQLLSLRQYPMSVDNPAESDANLEIREQSDRILALSKLQDLNHHVVGVIQVSTARTLHHGGQLSLMILFALNLLGGTVLLLLFLRLFRKHVTERFNLLENGLKQLVHANWTTQLHIEGQDEISQASKIINQLVESKQLSRLALDEVEQKFAALYENASVGILMIHDNQILSLNETARHMLGYEQQDSLLDKPFSQLFPTPAPAERYSQIRFNQMLALGHRMVEWELIGHSGWRLPCELNLTPLTHTGDPGWLITIRDITERRNSESKIKRLSLYDNLTGLLNRHQLQALLQGDLERRTSDAAYFALLYIDIAHFKNINDTFGHSTGDEVLREIAARLTRQMGEQILARIAGDEFVLYLPRISTFFQPMRLANHIRAWIAEPIAVDDNELTVTACIGVVIGGSEFTSAEDVLRCADYALSRAKHHPHQLKLFTRHLYREALESTLIKRDLPHAIRNDHLIAYFQPIVDAQHGRMVGIEALARWNHPEQGFISPAKFIPIAEEGTLILELGEKILFQACHIGHQLNQSRQAAGLSPLLIHVNLSARHFASHTLLPTLEETLRITQLPPEQLAIEITETMLLESPRESIRRMQRIKQLGIHLALDDFGTGYSALNTLCQYPIDVVKLDRSFVLRLMEGKQGELLVRAIINMARDLGLDVIAEGVETQAQQQRLCALGIREIQGFFYYRPMSADDLMALQQN